LSPFRISRVDRAAYELLTPDGPIQLPSAPLPEPATVGDWVEVDDGRVVGVLPRRSLLARGGPGRSSQVQPLAANVDVVLVCAGLVGPLALRRLERLLALAWDSGATPVVVLTKADACDDVDTALREVRRCAPGADVVAVAASTGDVAALDPWLTPGTTIVLLGPSGAGKSTLVNALAGAEVMPTGDVRRVDGKGRHTTTSRQLIELPSGVVVIDTPGLRAVALQGEGLARTFPEVEELGSACRFADCRHVGEPGCAVLASVAAGDLGQDRVDSWRHLQKELAFQERRTDARLRAADRAKWRAVARQNRNRDRP
jgi:ribosome biogenesis GTPase / thiamine phosphate phosphatase